MSISPNHENHEERYHLDECSECRDEFDREAAWHGARFRAEAPYREGIALAREEIDSNRTGDLDADEMASIQRLLK